MIFDCFIQIGSEKCIQARQDVSAIRPPTGDVP